MRTISLEQVRVTNADRSRAVDRLVHALSEGSLTMTEFEQRTEAALAARTRGELADLIVDLPNDFTGTAPPPNQPGLPASRVQSLHALTAVWLLLSVVIAIGWAVLGLVTGHLGGPWPLWAIGPTGAVVSTLWLAATR
ncbi:MAG: DUF1707 SHOCT-like domain-containing protein [Sciscionella sp.]